MGDLIQLHLPLDPPSPEAFFAALERARSPRAKERVAREMAARYEAHVEFLRAEAAERERLWRLGAAKAEDLVRFFRGPSL